MHQVRPHSLHMCLSVAYLVTSRPLLGQKPEKMHYALFQGAADYNRPARCASLVAPGVVTTKIIYR